ncbi:MAG: SBBP repeat-containing protein [Anaerolineales bacterium]|nr:SBBP repeat-containing protein [Anaerolineales bacterium]
MGGLSYYEDIFVSKLDGNGNFVWAKSMGGAEWDYGKDIALDSSGNVYTTGTFSAVADFDPGPGIFNLTSAAPYNFGSDDIFITKLENDTVAPTVVSFTALHLTGLNIPITAFTASDAEGVAGYMITTSSTPPAVGDVGWAGTVPAVYTVITDGNYTLYPWAKMPRVISQPCSLQQVLPLMPPHQPFPPACVQVLVPAHYPV